MERIKEILNEIEAAESTYKEMKPYEEHKKTESRVRELKKKAKKIMAEETGTEEGKFTYMAWDDFMLLVSCVIGYNDRQKKAA